MQRPSLSRLIPVKERERWETTGCIETQDRRSAAPQLADQHSSTRLLIRRFGVRVPGGPLANPQVRGPFQFR